MKKIFSLLTLLNVFSLPCCAADRQHNPIYRRIGDNIIHTATAGALTGVLAWAASTSTTTSCCIIYSIGAGACGGAMIVSSKFVYQRCREYQEQQGQHNALAHQAEFAIRYNLPQAQQVMDLAPQAVQPRLP